MTESGPAKVQAAIRTGTWNLAASDFFERLAPTYQKQFIGWIAAAKRPETGTMRLNASLLLLKSGKKLGLE